MKRKIFSVFFALVLVLSFSLVPVLPTGAATIDVSSGGNIQAAINSASEGDIITVEAGTCTENIDVNKRVILQAVGVVIVTPASASDHIFHVTADHVTIDGFTLVGDALEPTSKGILLEGATGCTISNNNWSSTMNGAIWLDGANSNFIQGNTVTGSGNGIYLLNSDSNVIKDNTCSGGGESILIAGSYNTIQGNTCSGSGVGCKITALLASDPCIGNMIKGNTYSNYIIGICIQASLDNSISDTDVIGNTLTLNLTGILLGSYGAALGISIIENTCQSNTSSGIQINSAPAGSIISIRNNDISSNPVGIAIGASDASLVRLGPANSIVDNTVYGVENQDTEILDATGNWWGTTVVGEIQAMLVGPVNYASWLTTAPASVGLTVEPDILPTVATSAASAISFTTTTLNGNLSDRGTATQVDVWFEWGTTTAYGETTPFETKTVTGTFTAGLTGLTENTDYHFRAVARSADGTSYGNDATFHTIKAPAVTTQAASSVDLYSATLNGNLTDMGTATSVNVCFGWDTTSHSGEPTAYTNWTTVESMSATGAFSADLTVLTHNTTYYFRAKAVGDSTVYGGEFSFTTVAERVGISVSPTSIDFGSILAGESSDTKTVTVTNEGNITEKFTTTLNAEDPLGFYTANLAIDNVAVDVWLEENVLVDGAATPGLVLSMPSDATIGSKTATIIFWVVKQ